MPFRHGGDLSACVLSHLGHGGDFSACVLRDEPFGHGVDSQHVYCMLSHLGMEVIS